MNEEKERKIYDFIKGNLINFVIILTSIGYLIFGQFVIKRNPDITIEGMIAKAGLSVIIGFLIKQAMSENGFNYGYRSHIWTDALNSYSSTCNIANEYIELVDNFYLYEEIDKKREYRRANLMAMRLKYDDFFNDDGEYIATEEQLKKLDKKQKRVVKKCVKVKIYQLNLFSEYSNLVSADTKKEKTDKDQRRKMVGKNSLAQIISATIGAYFIPELIDGAWNWSSFVMSSIQLAIWLGCGVAQLYTNYNYVVIDKVNKLTRKKELILKFTRGCQKGLYKINPYAKEQSDEIQK